MSITHLTHLWPNSPICLWGIWFIFSCRGYFGFSTIFWVYCRIGWPSFSLKGISIVFKWILNYISSNFGFFLMIQGYCGLFTGFILNFSYFLALGGILVIFWVGFKGVGPPFLRLSPKSRWTQAQKSQNNEFVESGLEN